jgi:hypothetical protein
MGEDARRFVLMGLLTLWAVAWGLSILAFATIPSDEETAWGSARMMAFLGWQLAATLPAFAAWALSRSWPRESGVRAVARIALQLSVGLVAVVGGLVLWALMSSA